MISHALVVPTQNHLGQILDRSGLSTSHSINLSGQLNEVTQCCTVQWPIAVSNALVQQ